MGLGKKGISSVKLEDFKEHFEELMSYAPKHKVQTKIAMPVDEYYDIGVYCIENNLSIVGFIRFAYKERIALAQKGLIQPDKDNSEEIAYKVVNSPVSEGKLC